MGGRAGGRRARAPGINEGKEIGPRGPLSLPPRIYRILTYFEQRCNHGFEFSIYFYYYYTYELVHYIYSRSSSI